ncbi:MAG TPA: GDSL-type esterase/lipase family protein [Polyangiaceae bacterium]|nr:GDSL-type esterase/lipase family protein [Polyangiaceae bacterium]
MPGVRFLPLCVLAGGLFASSARAEPRKPTHVACVGDSITAGAGASSPAKNYVSLLQGLLGAGAQVQNFGHSGTTLLSPGFGDNPYVLVTEYTKATDFVSGAGAGAVVSVIIMLGTNDSKPFNWEPAGKPKNDQQYAADYRTLIDHFTSLSTKPVVYVAYPLATGTNPCCSIRGDVIHDQELPLIKQVATEKRVPIIDLNTDTLNHPEYFGDGVHPTDAGYVVMTNLVKKGIDREPSVSITSPSMGAMPGQGMLPLTADASADTVDIVSVEFFEGATSLGKVTTKPFTLMWQATTGAHSITAKATDTTLANATSMPVTFTVTDAAAAGTGGGGSAGAAAGGSASAGTPSGGAATGGAATAGASAAGTSAATSGAAGAAVSGAGGAAGGAVSSPTPAATGTITNSGCSCALPGSPRSGGVGWLLFGVALLSLRQLRRRPI